MALRTLSATDVAIAVAIRAGTLRVEEFAGRFGPFWTISDDFGLIEVADTAEEANARVGAIREAANG